MSGQSDLADAGEKLVTSGGFAALGSTVHLRVSDGTRFVFGFPNIAVKETDFTRETKNDQPTDVLAYNGTPPVCSGDAGAAIVHSVWLVGTKGAVMMPWTTDMRQPILAGNGNEVTLDGLRWTLPA